MIGAFVQLNSDSHMATAKPVGYVVCENGCWEWVGTLSDDGYGCVWDKSAGKVVKAHKWIWEQENGPVPDGLELDHVACSNPRCCNPGHLKAVTHRENVRRGNGWAGQHARKTHCLKGHALTEDNLVPYRRARGARICKACTLEYQREYQREYMRGVRARKRAEIAS